jgi:hypothetical protein
LQINQGLLHFDVSGCWQNRSWWKFLAFSWIEPLLSGQQSLYHVEVLLGSEQFRNVLGLQNLVAVGFTLIWEKVSTAVLPKINPKFGICAHTTSVSDMTLSQ